MQTRDGTTYSKDAAPDNTILRPTAFASKSLTSAEQRYSSIKREALDILHGLKKFHHYSFAREVSIITDHKPLVAIFKKATLSQRIQYIFLWIYQYWVRIIYKPGPDFFIMDWLSRHNHMENKDEEICGMDVRVDAIQMTTYIWECMSITQIQQATMHDEHLQ